MSRPIKGWQCNSKARYKGNIPNNGCGNHHCWKNRATFTVADRKFRLLGALIVQKSYDKLITAVCAVSTGTRTHGQTKIVMKISLKHFTCNVVGFSSLRDSSQSWQMLHCNHSLQLAQCVLSMVHISLLHIASFHAHISRVPTVTRGLFRCQITALYRGCGLGVWYTNKTVGCGAKVVHEGIVFCGKVNWQVGFLHGNASRPMEFMILITPVFWGLYGVQSKKETTHLTSGRPAIRGCAEGMYVQKTSETAYQPQWSVISNCGSLNSCNATLADTIEHWCLNTMFW